MLDLVGVVVRVYRTMRTSLGMALLGLHQGKAHLLLYIDSSIYTDVLTNASLDHVILVTGRYSCRSGAVFHTASDSCGCCIEAETRSNRHRVSVPAATLHVRLL